MIAEAECCSDSILGMPSVGFSRGSTVSVDPCEAPGAEEGLSNLSTMLSVGGPATTTGSLNLESMFPEACREQLDLNGVLLSLEAPAEEDESMRDPETSTYSRSINSNESATVG